LSREATRKEHKTKMLNGRKEKEGYIRRKAVEFGLLKAPPEDKTESNGDIAKRIKKMLKARGWTAKESQDAISACERHGVSCKKLFTITRLGLDHEKTLLFMEAYRGLADIDIAVDFSGEISVKLLADILPKLGNDVARLDDFIEFCKDSVDDLEGLGQRPNIRIALKRLLAIFKASYEGTSASESMNMIADISKHVVLSPDRKEVPGAEQMVVKDADRKQMEKLRIS